MPRKITNKKFKECIEYYYGVLKKGYLKEISEATDTEYAKKHFQRVFFLENDFVPYMSVLFQELRFTYHHFSKLNEKTAYDKTLKILPQIRTVSKKRLSDAQKYQKGDHSVLISEWYIEHIESGKADLDELILIEKRVLESTDENLIGALAVHLAGQRLYQEFKSSSEVKEKQVKATKHNFTFTRNEQILALYYLIRSFGINPYQACDRTKLSALFHLVMGVPFEKKSKIKDLAIYKGLSCAPQVVKDSNQLLKYLEKIRNYFFEANFIQVVDLIDKEIERCKHENQ
jgi:hypothetical protein